jgi:hypothetical protein
LGRGARNSIRWKKDRQRKKKARDAKQVEQKKAAAAAQH